MLDFVFRAPLYGFSLGREIFALSEVAREQLRKVKIVRWTIRAIPKASGLMLTLSLNPEETGSVGIDRTRINWRFVTHLRESATIRW